MSLYRRVVDVRNARAGGDDGAPRRLREPARFAQALRARYRRGSRPLPRLELSLASRHSAGDLVLHQHKLHVLNPVTVVLRSVLQRVEMPATQVVVEAAMPVASSVVPIGRSARPAAAPLAVAPLAPMPVLQRLAARATRVETELGARPSPAPPLSAPASARPAPPSHSRLPDDLPLRRPPVGVPLVTPAATSTASDAGTAQPPRGPTSAPAYSLAPHEIERITEQVMSSLDRRILAERERRGRF